MAVVILGGLVTTTLLSLFVLPALYLRFAPLRARAGRRARGRAAAPLGRRRRRGRGRRDLPGRERRPVAAGGRRRAGQRRRRESRDRGGEPVAAHGSLPAAAVVAVVAAPAALGLQGGRGGDRGRLRAREARGGQGQGDDFKRVTFTKEGRRRTDLETAPCARGGDKVVPYEALIYDDEGKTFVYTSPKPLSYLREPVKVDRIEGTACCSEGRPPAPRS